MADRRLVALLAAFTFLCLFQISTREPIFNDEIINLARTERGFSNLWGNLLDYSLRPFYRVMNQFWRELFGPTLSGMWLGSVTVAVFAAIGLQALGMRLGSRYAAGLGPLFLVTSPEFVRVGLGNMPHLMSGSLAIASVYFLARWLVPGPAQQEPGLSGKMMAAAAALLAAIAVLTHPTQLGFLAGLIAITIGAVLCEYFAEDRVIGVRTRQKFAEAATAWLTVAAALVCIDVLYRVALSGTPEPRLPKGFDYSYLNLWIGNSQAMDTHLAQYGKPFAFYWRQLATGYPVFTIVTVTLAFASAAVSFVRLREGTSRRIDLFCMATCFLMLVWLIIASIAKMKTDYTLAAWAPLAAAANVAAVAQLTGYFSGEKRLGLASSTVISLALVIWAGASFASQRSALQAEVQIKAPQLAAPYRILAALPPGPMGVLTVPDQSAKAQRVTNSCRNFASATQRPDVAIMLDQDTTIPEKPIKSAGHPLVLCFSAELSSSHGELLKSFQNESGYHRLLRSKRGVELWVRPSEATVTRAPRT